MNTVSAHFKKSETSIYLTNELNEGKENIEFILPLHCGKNANTTLSITTNPLTNTPKISFKSEVKGEEMYEGVIKPPRKKLEDQNEVYNVSLYILIKIDAHISGMWMKRHGVKHHKHPKKRWTNNPPKPNSTTWKASGNWRRN